MERTLFCFPTEAEASTFRTLRPDADVRIIGVGMAMSAAMATAAIIAAKPQRVVLCGIAGACDERLEVGQVVEVVRDAEAGLPAAYAKAYEMCRATDLMAVESLTVSHSGDALPYIERGAKPCVEQMEGASVAAACEVVGGVEFHHLRSISNRVGDDRNLWRVRDAIEALGEAAARYF